MSNKHMGTCPFCGSKGGVMANEDKKYRPFCQNHRCQAEINLWFSSWEEAVDAWNTQEGRKDEELFAQFHALWDLHLRCILGENYKTDLMHAGEYSYAELLKTITDYERTRGPLKKISPENIRAHYNHLCGIWEQLLKKVMGDSYYSADTCGGMQGHEISYQDLLNTLTKRGALSGQKRKFQERWFKS